MINQKEEFFFHLTPDVIMQAMENSGFEPTGHLMALNSYENRVYDIKLEDNSHIVTKFYRPGRWNRQQILEEHSFLQELASDEITVCSPLPFSDGTTLHETEGIYYAVWPRTGGRAGEELNDIELEILGRLLARIHNMGASKKSEHRIKLTGETYGLEPLKFLEENDFIPEQFKTRYRNAVLEIVSLYDSLAKDVPFHRIHGDCHMGNILNGSEGWFFLDFDDFLVGPAVQDVWMIVPARDREGLRQREVFINAYRQFRDFNSSWFKLIEPLRALRFIMYAGWIATRWEDPAFPAAFPHFGTEKYWEEETADLEDQINHYYKEVEPEPFSDKNKMETEEELTNKDFFWDMEE